MRLLLWHCAELSFSDRVVSSRPAGIGGFASNPSGGRWEDVLAVFICAESEDSSVQTEAACRCVLETLDRIGQREVVVVPFAHLSSATATPAAAVQVIDALARLLREEGAVVSVTSFGYHKDFSLSYVAKGYPGSVGYRQFD